MKYLKHRIYGLLFKLFKYTYVDENKISFIIDSNESFKGNLEYVKNEFDKRGDFEFNFFYKDKLSFKSFKELAGSKFIFLNDNFFPLAFMDFNYKSIVVQLWHAPGAFKKFGGSLESENSNMLSKISKNIDYLIVSSNNVRDNYAEAFQIPKTKIKALGIPRADYYFENHNIDGLKSSFCEKYNISKDKKIILYAPTFRQEEKYNNVFDYLDLDKFNDSLGEEYILALRLHPKIKNFCSNEIYSNGKYIDCSDYKNEQELLLISDMLITDYSSIMIEFSLLSKPIIFFVYDFDEYMLKERGFYFDFKKTVPGPIVYNSNQLIESIKSGDFDKGKISDFVKTQFNEKDGGSSKRIVDFLLEYGR